MFLACFQTVTGFVSYPLGTAQFGIRLPHALLRSLLVTDSRNRAAECFRTRAMGPDIKMFFGRSHKWESL